MLEAVVPPRFDFSGIAYEVGTPDDFTDDHFRRMREVYVDGLTADLTERMGGPSAAKVLSNVLPYDHDGDYWVANHRNPQVAVEHRDIRPAAFADPRVVVARAGGRIVGFVTSWKTASGETDADQQRKMRIPPQLTSIPQVGGNYAWQRDIGVDPNFWHRGIGHGLGYLSITQRHPYCQVSDYLIVGVSTNIGPYQDQLGLKYTGTDLPASVDPEQEQEVAIKLARYQGRVGRIAQNIINLPGFSEAISQAVIDRKTPYYTSNWLFSRAHQPLPPLQDPDRFQFPDGTGYPR